MWAFTWRVFVASGLAWLCAMLVAYVIYMPREGPWDVEAVGSSAQAALAFNPFFVAAVSMVASRILREWLSRRDLNRLTFSGWVIVVTVGTSILFGMVFSVPQGPSEMAESLLTTYFWVFLGALPLWSFLGGIVVGPPASSPSA